MRIELESSLHLWTQAGLLDPSQAARIQSYETSRAPRPAWSDGTTLEELVGAGATPHVTIDRGRVAIVLPPRTAAIYRANPAPQESGGHAARLSLDTLPRSP